MDRREVTERLRAKLRAGGTSIGSWMQIPHGSVAEIMGQAGYDWVALDLEHGAIAVHQLPDLCRALELGGTLPLARLAHGHAKDCKQALDAGINLVTVSRLLGHERLETTAIYTTPSAQDLEKAVEKLEADYITMEGGD